MGGEREDDIEERDMTPKVEFHFDFGSPNAYFSHKVIPGIESRTGARFAYVPILLGGVFKLTNNQPPMVAFKDVKNKQAYQRLEIMRFIRKHGLAAFKMNPHFPVNTVQIMRGAVAAGMDGYLPKYVDAVFRHMWEEGKKMDDPEVIRAALDASGLDGTRTLARIQEQEVKDKLLKNTEASVARGTFGAPTFFVGEEIFFGKDRLRDVEEEIVAQTK
jgi:2-hydroxychromene-2-carboxylate isomerase